MAIRSAPTALPAAVSSEYTGPARADRICGGESAFAFSGEGAAFGKSPLQTAFFCAADSYRPGESLTYTAVLRNRSCEPLCSLEITDNLGARISQGVPLRPLSYEGPVRLYVNGCFISCISPSFVSEEGAVFSILYLAPKTTASLVYDVRVSEKAPVEAGAVIISCAAVSSSRLPEPETASWAVPLRRVDPPQAENPAASYGESLPGKYMYTPSAAPPPFD